MLNAKKHKRSLWVLSCAGTLIALAFLLYDEAEIHGLIVACLVLFCSLFVINKLANSGEYHRKYLEYRVLAETLRVQFFLLTAGVKEPVHNILPWFVNNAIPWIGDVLLTLNLPTCEKKRITDIWVKNQRIYHENALDDAKADKKKQNRTITIAIIITIITYIIALLFEIYVYKGLTVGIDENKVRAVLKLAVGFSSAATLFVGNYYGKMSLSYNINDHKRMISLYEKIEKNFSTEGETEELIMHLAEQCLIENSIWYSYQTKNKPDIVFG